MEVAGVILAGGQSKRFGQLPKAVSSLGGAPLLIHVIERLSPQVSALALSVESRNPLFNSYGLDQIEDPSPGSQGPLPALLSSLRWLRSLETTEWLQLAPCDSPFLPQDLVGRLGVQVGVKDARGCIPEFRGELQPTFGLWHLSLLSAVEQAVSQGMRGFKDFLNVHPVSVLEWPEPLSGPKNPFFNINTRNHLQQAERML